MIMIVFGNGKVFVEDLEAGYQKGRFRRALFYTIREELIEAVDPSEIQGAAIAPAISVLLNS